MDRHWPESVRSDPVSTAEIGALLAGLEEALDEIHDGRGGVLADDAAFSRKAQSLRIRLEALRALELRAMAAAGAALREDVAGVVLDILSSEMIVDIRAVMVEALGYYALPMPDERPGDNEAPLGGAYARSARQGMLARLFDSPGTADAQRDRLARVLLEAGNPSEPGKGH